MTGACSSANRSHRETRKIPIRRGCIPFRGDFVSRSGDETAIYRYPREVQDGQRHSANIRERREDRRLWMREDGEWARLPLQQANLPAHSGPGGNCNRWVPGRQGNEVFSELDFQWTTVSGSQGGFRNERQPVEQQSAGDWYDNASSCRALPSLWNLCLSSKEAGLRF